MKRLVELLVRSRETLEAAIARAHPEECCALIYAGERDEGGLVLELVPNIADLLHAADPESFPRTARTGYAIDTRLIMKAEREGHTLVAIVHSHPDGGTALSAEDLRLATLPMGGPSWPGVAQVVLDGRGGRLGGFAVHVWDGSASSFEMVARWPDSVEERPAGWPRAGAIAPILAVESERRSCKSLGPSPGMSGKPASKA